MRVIKKAVQIGNGAAIYVPKEYSGRELVVLLPEGLDEIKKRVLNLLIDYMPNIIGVYLFGSYARGEHEIGSDIDVLVITKEKDDSIKKALAGIDSRVMPLKGVKEAIKNAPLLIMPLIKEAKVLLNPLLIEELKSSKIDFKKFSWNFEDIKRIIKIVHGFTELDDKKSSSSFIYSLIMRFRICYIMECLLKNKRFSNQGVEAVLSEYKFTKEEIKMFFNIYREIRDDSEQDKKINKEYLLRLINALKSYSQKIEHETKKKIEKRN